MINIGYICNTVMVCYGGFDIFLITFLLLFQVEWNLKLRDYGPLRGASEGAYQSWERDYERLFVHTVRRVVWLENPQQARLYLGSSPTNGPLVTDAAHFQDIVDPVSMDDNTMSWGYPNDEWRGTVHAWYWDIVYSVTCKLYNLPKMYTSYLD